MRRGRPAAIAVAITLIGASIFGGALSASATQPSGPPVIDPTLDGAIYAEPAVPVFNGTTPDNDTDVSVTLTPSVGAPIAYCSASTGSGNTWSGCTGTAIPDGDYTVTATGDLTLDPGLDPSADSSPIVIHVYDTAPVDLGTAPSGNTTDSTPHFDGFGPIGGTVDVKDGSNNTYCSVPVAADGSWSCDIGPLPLGAYAGFLARGINFGSGVTYDGNAAFTIVAPGAPTIDQTFGPPWRTSYPLPGIQGGKDLGVTSLVVSYAGIPYCSLSGLSDASTIWFCNSPNGTPMPLGTSTLTAVGTNDNGDTSTAGPGIDITVVTPPTIDGPADGVVTNDSSPTFSGTAPSGTGNITLWYGGEGSLCSTAVVGTTWSCNAADQPDGTYVYFADASPGINVSSTSRSITIDTVAPAAPTMGGPSGTTSDRTPTFFGNGEPGAQVTLIANGDAIPCASGTGVVNQSGLWQCTSAVSLDLDSYSVRAIQRDAATNVSPGSAAILLTIATPTPPVTIPKPPLVWSFSTGGKTQFLPGDEVDITSSGLPPGSVVDAVLHSIPVKLGSTVVKPDGTFTLHVTIPTDTEPGAHYFVVTVTPPGEQPSVVEVPATVNPVTKEAVKGPHGPPVGVPTGGATGTERDDPAAPSSLTHSIPTLAELFSNPLVVGGAAAAGIVLLLLVGFPAELLNSTISEQYGRFTRRLHLPPVRVHWLERFTHWLHKSRLLGGIGITLAASIIFGFADPGFGFDVTSVRLVLACAIALFIVGYFASWLSGVILGRLWSLATTLELKPLGLILTVIGVAISRILDFSPGFMLGLILGISLVGHTTVAQRAKATLVQAGVVFVLSVLGWVGYSILAATAAPDSFGTALAFDTMVAITAEGLTGLFVGMLPIRFLDGASIYAYSRVIWGAVFGFATVTFLFAVLPASWGQVTGSIWLWSSIVGGFAVIAVGVYLYFRFWAPPLEDDEDGDAVDGVAAKPAKAAKTRESVH